jgi:formyltetrahydrofolate-dependent phosphoribosylglycinamide formyltransferase
MPKVKTAVFISGRGSNLLSLLKAQNDPHCPFQIQLVVSNNEDAGGLKLAQDHGVQWAIFPNSAYKKDREGQEGAIHQLLVEQKIELVALAGYMRVLTPWFVAQWSQRIINIHPSLLPKYPGLHTHQRALAAGDQEHGCTVHYVTKVLDAGPIILQAKVPVEPGDTESDLSLRVLVQEHLIYPQALSLVSQQLCDKKIVGEKGISLEKPVDS